MTLSEGRIHGSQDLLAPPEMLLADLFLQRSPGLAKAVAARLSQAILSGQFEPGERLLETVLAQRLDVSRASLREALRTLEAEGLVEIRQGKGAYVINPSPEEIEQMSLFRALLEGAAARLVASRRDPRSLSRLSAILERQGQIVSGLDDYEAFLTSHWEFHHAICEESGNSYVVKAIQSASYAIRIYHRIKRPVGPQMFRNNTVYLNAMSCLSPYEAESILRSQVIRAAYEMLAKDIPEAVQPYVTCFIDTDYQIRWLCEDGAGQPAMKISSLSG